MMTREEARQFVDLFAGATTVSPALTAEEVDAVLGTCRIVDAAGRHIMADGYVETIWGTRAVVAVLEVKLAKVAAKTDLVADGASIYASQVTANLTAQRKSWRSKMLPGSA